MEISQFVLAVLLAIFAMIGPGRSTASRVKIGWVILFLILIICGAYILFALFELVLFSCKKIRGVDYKEEWSKNKDDKSSEKDS